MISVATNLKLRTAEYMQRKRLILLNTLQQLGHFDLFIFAVRDEN